MNVEFYWVAVAIVTIVSAARLTRVAVIDTFPPVKFVRDRLFDFLDKTERRRAWQPITWCGYCMSSWTTAAVVVWAYLAGVLDNQSAFGWGMKDDLSASIWWLVNGTLAASYLAVILVANDGDKTTTGAES